MLVLGDFSLDSIQMYSDSFKEALKQTMLSQEVMFRKQVLQLHQLYGIQRILMQKFDFEEFYRSSFKKAGMKPTFVSYAYPIRHDPSMKESELSLIRMLEKHPTKNYKLRHRPLDLQLPPDQCVSLIELDIEELDLSLDLKMRHPEKENDREILSYKKSRRMLFEEIIDLEDSIDEDGENVYCLDLNVPPIQSIEFEKNHVHISSDNLPIKNEQLRPYETGYLDLNETHNDDLITTSYSTSSSSLKGAVGEGQQANCSSPIWVREKNNCSTESSTLEQDANLDVMDCGSRHERTETQSTEFKFKGTSTGEMNSCQCDEAPMGSTVNFSKDSSECYDEESNKLEAVIEPLADRHGRLHKSEVCSAEDSCDKILTVMVSDMSTCNAENDLGGENKEQNLSLPMSNQCYETQKELHSTETIFSIEQDHRFSDSIESEHDEESSEMKVLLQNAVETLICMSLADSVFDHDCNTKTESNDMGKDQVQPQHSCDSFELLVLKQTENNKDDEFSVSSSQLSEITDMENMNVGVILRRGRRMKDFRRDILPSLSSLSRHEIREDINIMEAVLRSREYRKNRPEMQDGQKGCTPMNSKQSRSQARSRLNDTRRRIIL